MREVDADQRFIEVVEAGGRGSASRAARCERGRETGAHLFAHSALKFPALTTDEYVRMYIDSALSPATKHSAPPKLSGAPKERAEQRSQRLTGQHSEHRDCERHDGVGARGHIVHEGPLEGFELQT